MYLSVKQHDLFRTLLMGFEIPFRMYVSDTVLKQYATYEDFQRALDLRKNGLTPSDHTFLRKNLPDNCKNAKCHKLYNKFLAANQHQFDEVVPAEEEMPMVGELNLVTFVLQNEFSNLYFLFGSYWDYCILAEKYRYARNKLDHPGCKTLEDNELTPVLAFVKDILNFMDDSYFPQKEKEELLREVSVLQNRRIEIPIKKHNFNEMPYTESKIVCREKEIAQLKHFVCGRPGDLRKRHSCCVYGYGGVGKTALTLEVVKRIVQDIWDEEALNDYKPEYVLFFSAKRNKLEIASANGRIVERTIHKHFKSEEELISLILEALGLENFKDYHEEGIIIVDNLEALSMDEREKIKYFIEVQTPSEMQFLLTSRNSEEYEVNLKLSGFEHGSGVDFINEYIAENGLDLELTETEMEELLSLSKGNTLVLVLCLRRLSQKLSSISGLRTEFSSTNAWRNIRDGLGKFPGNAYEVISEFMFKDTFEEIEKSFTEYQSLFYKILKIFAVYQNDGVDLNTICILSQESYLDVERVADTLCNYLILEKMGEKYCLNDFAEKYIVNRFMPDVTVYDQLSMEIRKREADVQREVRELNRDIKARPELVKILSDWCVVSDSDRITAASMYRLYKEADQECRKDSAFKARAVLEDVILKSKEAEQITTHPYIKFQKARILRLIDRSKILSEEHTEEIIEAFRTAIFVIKTIEQYTKIQQTKSYASLLWVFGQYLSEVGKKDEAIRYLEEACDAFKNIGKKDKEYYKCMSKLGSEYLEYFEEDALNRGKYLQLARKINQKFQSNPSKYGVLGRHVSQLNENVQRYRNFKL